MPAVWQLAASIQNSMSFPSSKMPPGKSKNQNSHCVISELVKAPLPNADHRPSNQFANEKLTDDHSTKTRLRNTMARASSKARTEQQHESQTCWGQSRPHSWPSRLSSTRTSLNGKPDQPPTTGKAERRSVTRTPRCQMAAARPATHSTAKARKECECEPLPV